MDEPVISIDAEFQLRILNPEVQERSTRLVADCELFVSSTYSLHYAVHSSIRGLSLPFHGKFPSLISLTTIPPLPPTLSLSAMPTRRSPTMLSICHMNTRNKEVREFQAIVKTIHANMDRMVKNADRQRLKAIGKRIILEKRRNSNEDALR